MLNIPSQESLDYQYKKIIAQYLSKQIAEDNLFKEKCSTSKKTLDGVLDFVKCEAKKQAQDNCAVIPDNEVFQWAKHYIEEDSLDFEKKEIKKTIKANPVIKKEIKADVETPKTLKEEVETLTYENAFGF